MKNINLSNNKFCIDSRDIKKNSIFICLKGKKTNGHNFVKKNIKKNCKFIINKKFKLEKKFNIYKKKLIRTNSPLKTLTLLARLKRKNLKGILFGITGSCGKTTVKEMLHFFLSSYSTTYKSPKSFNNKIGLPLSILNQPTNSSYNFYELGMNRLGEIDFLSKILKPYIGIITNIAPAHIGPLKSLKNIFKAKSEIIKNIDKFGYIILNSDCKYFNKLKKVAIKHKIKIISFGIHNKADIKFKKIVKNKCYIEEDNKIIDFDVKDKSEIFISNILIVFSVLNILKLNKNKILKKISQFSNIKGRGNLIKLKIKNKKIAIVDDSYNSNPLSVKQSINRFSALNITKYKNKYIFLGDMLELGNLSNKFHYDLAKYINQTSVKKVYCVGTKTNITFKNLKFEKRGIYFPNITALDNSLDDLFVDNAIYLFKGSNGTGLNKILSKRIYNVK